MSDIPDFDHLIEQARDQLDNEASAEVARRAQTDAALRQSQQSALDSTRLREVVRGEAIEVAGRLRSGGVLPETLGVSERVDWRRIARLRQRPRSLNGQGPIFPKLNERSRENSTDSLLRRHIIQLWDTKQPIVYERDSDEDVPVRVGGYLLSPEGTVYSRFDTRFIKRIGNVAMTTRIDFETQHVNYVRESLARLVAMHF